MKYLVDVQRECQSENLPSDAQFLLWVTTALKGRKDRGEICIRLVDADESQALNSEYRAKDYATNVLSFPFEAPPGIPMDLLGDLAICAEVVKREAAEQGKPLMDHWAHMVIHGTLHLIGFDHINEPDAVEMETLETELLASLNIADPYTQGE